MKKTPPWAKGIFHLVMGALAVLAAPAVHAVDVTTYGAGLQSCKTYLDARGGSTSEQVPFIDWLSGYFSGVNKTSTHRNSYLGLADLNAALDSLDTYCNARPLAPFAAAAGILVLGVKPGPAAHATEAPSYGAADKSCQAYGEARAQTELSYWAEFTDWLGGYLSGVNAISLRTSNILGNAALRDAVRWLDDYCGAHSPTSFSAAVEALVAASSPGTATPGVAQSKPRQSWMQSSSTPSSETPAADTALSVKRKF
jgi:hypothetical protein